MSLTPYRRFNGIDAFNPFQAMEELERRFFSDSDTGAFKTDIRDTGNAFVLEADLPGFKKEDISIDVEENRLTISATRHSDYEQKDQKGNYLRCERSFGSFSRSFDTTGIDTEALSASFTDGVLTLTMPKLVETKPNSRKLEIS